MTLYDMFRWFGSGYGNIIELGKIQLSAVDTPMLGAFIAAAVQMFYCYRIYTINKKAWWISVFVALVRTSFFSISGFLLTLLQLALTQVAAGLFSAVVVRSLIYFLHFTLS
jgi:hypothetical protein